MERSLTHQVCQGYHLMECIGRGGVAEVYRAVRQNDHRHAKAVKVMTPQAASETEKTKAFRREFEILADLDLEQVPRARQWASIENRPAIIMDLVPGQSLGQLRQRQAALNWLDQLHAATAIAAALHDRKVVHGDLKPDNFILDPQKRLHLVDFGSARRLGPFTGITEGFARKKSVWGTLIYMAPEVVRGKSVTFRSDCYSLGICTRVLLGDDQPFGKHEDQRSLMKAVTGGILPPTQARLPQLPASLIALIDACLQPDPKLRPADAHDFGNRLVACLRQARSQGQDLAPGNDLRTMSEHML